MIHNNFHNMNLNMAMSLSTVFFPEKVALVDILQPVAVYKERDNNSHMDILEVHSNNTFIFSPFSLNIFKVENECDILYICTSNLYTVTRVFS